MFQYGRGRVVVENGEVSEMGVGVRWAGRVM